MIKIYYSSIYFKSIAQGLEWVITRYWKSLGLEQVEQNHQTQQVQVVDTITKSDCRPRSQDIIWIVLGLQNAPPALPPNYIVWNFEQFEIVGAPDFNSKFWDQMAQAKQIWDYSLENIKWLKLNKGLDASHLPLGWMPQMKIPTEYPINPWESRTNTFVFVGLMGERRRNILKPCYELAKAKSLNMYLSNKCWDIEYNQIYSMTKYGLNIHYYTGKTILEVHRIIPLILNGIWVISERSGDPWYDNLFDSLVTWAEPDTFAQTLDQLNQMGCNQVQAELESRKRLLIETCSMYKFFIDGGFGQKLKNDLYACL